MGSFLNQAAKKNTDIKGFLRDAIGGNSIKYMAEKGASHNIYIPYKTSVEVKPDGTEQTVHEIVAISGSVHDWTMPDGKYKAIVCMKDVIIPVDENDLSKGYRNDGACPFCDRVSDAWDIFRYRKEAEEKSCHLVGEDRKKYIEKINTSFADERKAKDARPYIYLLVVKFRMASANNPVLGADGLPEYDLKVMKLSSARSDKIQQTVANAGTDFPGSELMISYPNNDDVRQVTLQSTTAPVFPDRRIVNRYPAVLDKITQDVAKFEWDGIEKSFPEWAGMTSAEANKITDSMFEKWDSYKTQVSINPSVRYMEYLNDTPVTNPSLGGGDDKASVAGAIGGAPTIPNAPVIPNIPAPDVNSVFSGNPSGITL